MLTTEEKSKIIDLKRAGRSTRKIAELLNINRGTISKYWNETQVKLDELGQKGTDERTIQNELYSPPVFQIRTRQKHKATEEFIKRLTHLVKQDVKKNELLGWEKQRLTNKQIHQTLLDEGFEISIATVNICLAKIRKPIKYPNVYIKQFYDYGRRLEFDYGEVKLDLGEGIKKYQMAVFCAPASNFRWCFLYDSQKQAAFLDSHVNFFELIGGVWKEVFYDNMRNVVTSFGPKNTKKLNSELLKLASYYGYEVRTTSPYAGNEKGSVERGVEVLRNRLFSLNHQFAGLDAVRKHIDIELRKINAGCDIEVEKTYLKPSPNAYELAEFSEGVVSKYGFVSSGGNRYSVPEQFVGKRVSVKTYYDEIRIMFDFVEIARHSRCKNKDEDIVDIMHFLHAFEKKPGALEHSVALKAIPKLKEIFELHFKDKPRKFIEVLKDNQNATLPELLSIFAKKIKNKATLNAKDVVKSDISVKSKTDEIIKGYADLAKGGGVQ